MNSVCSRAHHAIPRKIKSVIEENEDYKRLQLEPHKPLAPVSTFQYLPTNSPRKNAALSHFPFPQSCRTKPALLGY